MWTQKRLPCPTLIPPGLNLLTTRCSLAGVKGVGCFVALRCKTTSAGDVQASKQLLLVEFRQICQAKVQCAKLTPADSCLCLPQAKGQTCRVVV